jgi:hypothetical protein
MCRHAVGLNWSAIGIEHVGNSDQEVLSDPAENGEPGIGGVAALVAATTSRSATWSATTRASAVRITVRICQTRKSSPWRMT